MHKTLLWPEPQETKRLACVKKVWGPQRPTQAKVRFIPAPVKRLRELREGQKRSWEVPLGLGCGQGQDQGPEISEIGLLSRPPAGPAASLGVRTPPEPGKECGRNSRPVKQLFVVRPVGGRRGKICRPLSSCFSPQTGIGPRPRAQWGQERQPCGPPASLSPRRRLHFEPRRRQTERGGCTPAPPSGPRADLPLGTHASPAPRGQVSPASGGSLIPAPAEAASGWAEGCSGEGRGSGQQSPLVGCDPGAACSRAALESTSPAA